MNKNIFKSIGAVLAGFLVGLVLARITDIILEGAGVFPSVEEQQKHGFNEGWMLALTLLYRFIFTALGGFVTARLAPGNPMRHVMVLAVITTLIGTAGSIIVAITLDIFPVWYSVALAAISFPAIWLGGKLAAR